ncbi:MAG: hypothetical protein COX06_00900 [Candidatus Zambryskibacteria bacterium CG22_combo_CG10-13_8_21_14_all_42_17]|uniref:Uncharacterized protein n=1 Tax=Candidatus Zambryskibacteria bacterium CG22_combo_CG10-13_8_21_14_all_42_17 TaxID=1975118 RepID=A0A2H0BDZ9_9BACT|nr:MAG: hypothetical protein COX06_00900 [Candidatus Zambryskibacteria bacterium CG22_combo_CG10-13_8_21_14_all_42_17]
MNFENLINILDEDKEFVYVIVGGTALQGWMGESLSFYRENGTLRDIDIIVLEDPNKRSEYLQKLKFDMPVDFSFAKEESYRQPYQVLSQFKKNGNEQYSLVFRSVEVPLSKEVTALCRVNTITPTGIVNFQTFNPITLAHLYIHRVGILKMKDVIKIKRFVKKIHNSGVFDTVHTHYKVFHEYAAAIRHNYPFYSWAIRTYNYLDFSLNCRMSHKYIPSVILKKLINL